jgi:glutamate racemase
MNTNVTNNKFVNEWIAEMAELVKPENIVLIDGSKGTSSQLKRRLEEKDLLRDADHEGKVTILNSSEDPGMIELSKRLLEQKDPEVQND